MHPFSRLLRVIILPTACLGLLTLSGCGSRTVTVKGTLAPPPNVQLQDDDSVSINFVPDGGEGSGGLAIYTPANKSFVVKSADGKGIAHGKYKVVVNITPYPGQGSEQRANAFAELNGRFGPQGALTYDVTNDSNQDIVIDLGKGTVAKK
jgi:hypothetical protein